MIVEMVNLQVILFADVTVLWFDDLAKIRVGHFLLFGGIGRQSVGRGEDRLAAKLANARDVQPRLIAFLFAGFALALLRLGEAAAFLDVGTKNFTGGLEQAGAFLGR